MRAALVRRAHFASLTIVGVALTAWQSALPVLSGLPDGVAKRSVGCLRRAFAGSRRLDANDILGLWHQPLGERQRQFVPAHLRHRHARHGVHRHFRNDVDNSCKIMCAHTRPCGHCRYHADRSGLCVIDQHHAARHKLHHSCSRRAQTLCSVHVGCLGISVSELDTGSCRRSSNRPHNPTPKTKPTHIPTPNPHITNPYNQLIYQNHFPPHFANSATALQLPLLPIRDFAPLFIIRIRHFLTPPRYTLTL